MKGVIAAPVLAAWTACGGADQVTARFEVDDPAVTTIRMVVYEEGATPLSCDALAFSEIDPGALAQATVVEVSGERGERVDLGEIPRAGTKLFFAEGLTENGTSVVAGCESLGAIDGDVVVDIEVEPRLVFAPVTIQINSTDLRIGELKLTNLLGEQVNGEVRYTVIGPKGFETGGSLQQGQPVVVTSTLPPQPGPMRLQLRGRWAEPVERNAIQEPAAIDLPLGGAAVSPGIAALQVGLLGGQVGIMAMTGLAQQKTGKFFCFAPGSFTPAPEPDADMANVGALATVRDPGGGGKIVGASTDDFFELQCGAPVVSTVVPRQRAPIAATTLPSCDSDEADSAIYLQDVMGIIAISLDGAEITSFAGTPVINPAALAVTDGELVSAGCVDGGLETLPTVIVAQGRDGQLGLVTAQVVTKTGVGTEDEATRIQAAAAAVTAGSAFPATNPGPGGLQLGVVTDEGPQISHFDLQLLDANKVALDEVNADPTPSVVTALAAGDIDGDDLNDVVALVAFGDSVQVFMSLARPGTDDRLRGFFPGPVAERSAELRVFDVDGNGVDDIVLLGDTTLTVLNMGG